MTGEYAKRFNKLHPIKVEVNESTVDDVVKYGHLIKRSEAEMAEAIDIYKTLGNDVFYRPEEQSVEHEQQQWLATRYEPDTYYTTVQNSAPREIDCFTIVLGKKQGMTFPVDIHDQQVNALYDTGTGCSLINYSMYGTLGMDLDKGYQPIVKSFTRENMGALGQVTYTFTINGTPFIYSL